eukprot:GHVU01084852.1.p1 GENE.GHVU01084852.1~~GHVU01084852.1.p1  ORF type:complete len:319 (-),score=55.72 GHVU01084852.1:83-955(-)
MPNHRILNIGKTGHDVAAVLEDPILLEGSPRYLIARSYNARGHSTVAVSLPVTDRYQDAPRYKPHQVSFYDEDGARGLVAGTVRFSPPLRRDDVTHFEVWLVHEKDANSSQSDLGSHHTELGRIPNEHARVVYEYIINDTLLLNFENSIWVYCVNDYGRGPPEEVQLRDRAVPTAVPLSVAFEDTNDELGVVEGVVSITLGAHEEGVDRYMVAFTDYEGIKRYPAGGFVPPEYFPYNEYVVSATTGSDLVIPVPPTVVHSPSPILLVAAHNSDGFSIDYVTLPFPDLGRE